jgi:hypothetical protein
MVPVSLLPREFYLRVGISIESTRERAIKIFYHTHFEALLAHTPTLLLHSKLKASRMQLIINSAITSKLLCRGGRCVQSSFSRLGRSSSTRGVLLFQHTSIVLTQKIQHNNRSSSKTKETQINNSPS